MEAVMKLTKIVVGIVVGIIVALIAVAMVPSAKGQVSEPCCGMPTYTIQGVKVGTAADGTQYRTALWIQNVSAGDWSYTRMASIDPSTGVAVMTTTTLANGGIATGAGWTGAEPVRCGAFHHIRLPGQHGGRSDAERSALERVWIRSHGARGAFRCRAA